VKGIKFRRNDPKALEIILWFTNNEPGMDVYRICKLTFLADIWHLNTYGRPLTGDNYVAMRYGPVPTAAYNILRRKNNKLKHLGVSEFPFVVEKKARATQVFPAREPDLDAFSKSDVKALEHSFERYAHLSFEALRAMTHEHPAYRNAWDRRGEKQASDMDYRDFFEQELSDEDLEELQIFAEHGRV